MKTPRKGLDIWEVEKSFLDSKPLTPRQEAVAAAAMDSSNDREKLIACEAFIRQKQPHRLRSKALQEIEKMCARFIQTGAPSYSNLALILFSIPAEELFDIAILRAFLEKAVLHEDLRANSLLVLGRFAKRGDEGAIAILRAALNDPDESVRKNAAYRLSRLPSSNK